MRYGVPYKGSKNGIAEWIYSHFPKRTNFYDLFCGGCAILQVALMRQEYKNYFANDIDADGIKLFLNAIKGKYQNETRWISREDFFNLKDKDPYIKYCWSFGNNGRDYLYGEDLEPLKKAWHYAIFFNDFSRYKSCLALSAEQVFFCSSIKARYLSIKTLTPSSAIDKAS
jgi:site-specific DNA-adenine methylase